MSNLHYFGETVSDFRVNPNENNAAIQTNWI